MSLTIEAEDRINGLLDAALQRLQDQVLVANRPCVDALLDVYGVSDDASVRRACTDSLRRIGRVSLVRADEFRSDLQAVAAAVAGAAVERAVLSPAGSTLGIAEPVS